GNDISGATNDNYTATTSGLYTVEVNNGACGTTSLPVTVDVGPPTLNLGNDTAFCESKQPFALTINQPNASYMWSTGDSSQQLLITNLGGTYWAQVSLGPGCVTTDTITLDISPLPRVTGFFYIKEGGYTYYFEPSGAQYVDDYLWIFSDNTSDTNRKTTHVFPVGQSHAARLVISNQCGKDSVELQLPLTVQGVQGEGITADVYPNPTNGKLNVHVRAANRMTDVRISI